MSYLTWANVVRDIAGAFNGQDDGLVTHVTGLRA
jgi:hypothetical protein